MNNEIDQKVCWTLAKCDEMYGCIIQFFLVVQRPHEPFRIILGQQLREVTYCFDLSLGMTYYYVYNALFTSSTDYGVMFASYPCSPGALFHTFVPNTNIFIYYQQIDHI